MNYLHEHSISFWVWLVAMMVFLFCVYKFFEDLDLEIFDDDKEIDWFKTAAFKFPMYKDKDD